MQTKFPPRWTINVWTWTIFSIGSSNLNPGRAKKVFDQLLSNLNSTKTPCGFFFAVINDKWWCPDLGILASWGSHGCSTAAVRGLPASSNWRRGLEDKEAGQNETEVNTKNKQLFWSVFIRYSPLCLRKRPQWKQHSSFRTQLPWTLILYSAPQRQHIFVNAENKFRKKRINKPSFGLNKK